MALPRHVAASLAALVAALLLGPLLVVAAPAHAAPVKDLVLTLTSSSEPVSGEKVTFAGTAPTSLAGAKVALERRVGKTGDWVRVGTARVATDGTYGLVGVATGAGLNQWRATSKKQGVVHTSATRRTTVFGWFHLYDLDEVDYSGDIDSGSATIGGTQFAKSVWAAGYSQGYIDWIDYNLSYRCKTFEASIGIDDTSETGFSGAFSAYLDGAETPLGTKNLGPSTRVTLDVSTRLRIRLETTTLSHRIDGYLVWGKPRVLCSGKP